MTFLGPKPAVLQRKLLLSTGELHLWKQSMANVSSKFSEVWIHSYQSYPFGYL